MDYNKEENINKKIENKENENDGEGCLFDQVNYTDTGLECWPDHIAPNIILDDVSRLNATKVYSLNQVRSIKDIQDVLKLAEQYNQTVSIRGTKHSMGGQTLNENGVVIDMKYISHIEYSSKHNNVTVGTGCMWSDLIVYLNQFAKAPKTLQSYCSFSIGGTLSVNGHGITTDFTLSESVLSFKLIKENGEVIECSRDSEDNSESKELFGLCIGGYGLFGVIYEVTLKIKDNHRLTMDTIMTPINELPHVYEPMIDSMISKEIEIKLARIDITTFDVADIYLFRRVSDTPTISNLPVKPKEMSMASKTMYKWFAGPLREVRFAIEHSLGIALDWSEVNDSNSLLYESAKPLAQLYSPWLLIDDTFILQEYFVPKDNYSTWISQVRDIVLKQLSKETTITLLNITIRFVHKDTDTAIPYASSENGSYAFVFYFRIRRTSEADALLKSYHKRFTNITLQEGGTFYLPYRHHYTRKQLKLAYPGFDKFKEKQLKYDPNQRFSNLWWNHYSKNELNHHHHTGGDKSINIPKPKFDIISNDDDDESKSIIVEQLIEQTNIHRNNSFRALLKDPKMRQTFIETFLVEFLALTNNNSLMRIINTAIWDNRLKDDNEIYMKIVDHLSKQSGPLSEIIKVWNLVKQLAEQKRELVRETISVLSHIGKVDKINDIVSIGDHGKLITPLRNSLKLKGKTWIVHDDTEEDEKNVGATLERGTIDKKLLGTCIKIDYLHIKKNGREFSEIPDGSVDLVTLNQGLHHLPPKQIIDFLKGIYRILRAGGCFITREHDLDKDRKLIPMLDCAHMVFNALTGVHASFERDEIRGFRSLSDWRLIIESCGFKDTMIYEMQPHDPTIDMMMCFRKLPFNDQQSIDTTDITTTTTTTTNTTTESKINSILNQAPHITLSFIKDILNNLNIMLPKIQVDLTKTIKTLIPSNIPGLGDAVELLLNSYINPMLTMLARFEPLTEAAIPKINTSVNIIPEELTLLIDVIRERSKKNVSVVEIAIIGIIDQLIGIKNEAIAEVKQEESLPHPAKLLQQSLHDPIFITEIKQELSFILRDIPEFYDIPKVISEIGIPPRGSELLLGLLPEEPSIESFTQWIADKLDTHAWIQLKSAFIDIRNTKELPKIEKLLLAGSSWNRVAIAILSSSTIQFTTIQQRMAGWVGLGDIVKIWYKAQEERLKRTTAATTTTNTIELSKPILDILDKISPIQTYEGKSTTLSNVLCIVSAKHIHYSITGLFKSIETDITNEANECLCLKNGSLDLSETRPTLKKLSSFRAGENSFRVEYRLIPDTTTNTLKFKTNGSKLSNLLSKQGYIDGNHHVDRDALNHYKLPEWLQVDLIQTFGEFLNHTPWYRFPFINVLKCYFDVLFKEFNQVSQKTGIMQALGDQGFITSLIPGIVMSFIFSQMYLLGLPLRKLIGESYEETAGLYEELLVISPHSSKWNEIDSRISNVRSLGHGLVSFHIPTFKPFTDVILNLARKSFLTTILQISNNISIQVKLETLSTNIKHALKIIENFGEDVKINFNFNLFPKEQAEKLNLPQQISIDILVSSLTTFIRYIDNYKDIKIVQIYDFY